MHKDKCSYCLAREAKVTLADGIRVCRSCALEDALETKK